ncbi:MAG: hypothetical protein CMJ85_04945 [Planctomycetes bacterium]|nr:hypothetical protein [Planctomycetota bacterium]MDP6423190.1 hypothetical protein [Planctomycetota bacterium]
MNPGELERYQPSGRVGAGLVVVLPLAAIAAAGVGIGYDIAISTSPLVLLNPLLTMACGVVVGVVALTCLRVGKVRSAAAARRASLVVTLVCILAVALWAEAQPASVRLRVTLMFLLETVIILAISLAVPMSWWNKAVFCEDTQRFVPRRRLAKGYGPTPYALRAEAEEQGLDGVLARLRGYAENAKEGEFRFWLHETSTASYITVFWHGPLSGLRGREIDRDVLVLRRLRVDEPWIERLKGVCA